MHKKVTDEQILEVLQKFSRPPTIDAAAQELGIGHAALYERLVKLEKKGYLEKRGRYFYVKSESQLLKLL